MMRFEITDDYTTMSWTAAQLIADVIKMKPAATLVVAVGNSPLGTFQALAALRERGELNTSELRPFQLDEYFGVAADDFRSLYGWVKRDFLDPLAIVASRFTRLDGASTHPTVCQDYDALVEAAGGFDIAILGLGPNGHLGFNEPLSYSDSPTRKVSLTEASIKSNALYWGSREQVPPQAITCGMHHLLKARHIFLLVSGEHKRAILQRTVAGPITPEVPSSYLQQAANVVVITDRAAWPQ